MPGKDSDRETVIARHRRYFHERMRTDREFHQAVLALRGRKLGCFCWPQACHLDTVKAWLDAYCEHGVPKDLCQAGCAPLA